MSVASVLRNRLDVAGAGYVARDNPALGQIIDEMLAAVEAARDFCENSLDRGPSALTGDGREQPGNVWFVGSANDYGLPLMDALAVLYDTPAAATAASSEEET